MKLALHRSIAFWSGILVVGFLCWAWHDSERLWTTIEKGQTGINNGWGGLSLGSGTWEPKPGSPLKYERKSTASMADYYRHAPEILPAPFFLRARDIPKAEHERLIHQLLYDGAHGERAPFTIREMATISVGSGPAHCWVLWLPYWLLIAFTATAWLALLFWRARRRNKITP